MLMLDLETMLNSVSKEAILEHVATQIDTAIAKKIEVEAAMASYMRAKANVASDNYTSDDLIILQKALNDKIRARERKDADNSRRKDAGACTRTATISPAELVDVATKLSKSYGFPVSRRSGLQAVSMSQEEFENLIGTLEQK